MGTTLAALKLRMERTSKRILLVSQIIVSSPVVGLSTASVALCRIPVLQLMSCGITKATIFLGSFSSFFGAVLNISVMSALADIADEHELNSGMRLEGIFYSARTFFAKAMNAVGHIVAGFALQYYIVLPPQSLPGEVSEDVIFRLGIVDGPLAMIGGIIAGVVYLGYRIDKTALGSIQQRLDERQRRRSGF